MIHQQSLLQKGLAISLLIFSTIQAQGQFKELPYRENFFQLSFFPGVSTNGLSSAMYYNKFSINLTSGISAGNHYFELGVISNTHTRSSGGIQLAGLANIVGSNSYVNFTLGEQNQLIRDGDVSDLAGIQFSGLFNYVRNNVKGFQFTGGFNLNNGNASVIQFGGLGNYVGQSFGGIQVAGLFNNVNYGARGFQFSGLFNRAKFEMDGLQLSLVNLVGRLSGANSTQSTSRRGMQIGLVNLAKSNDGVQLGLFNKTKGFRGVQIGLINFYKPSPYQGEQGKGKYGVPIGLINIGGLSHMRFNTDGLFLINSELATGNCRNCTWTESQMPIDKRFQVHNVNALIFGYNPQENPTYQWTAGYGFQQMLYIKSSMSKSDFNNKRYFISYGLRGQHLNRSKKFDGAIRLLTKAHTELGYRLTKGGGLYLFGGVNMNWLLNDDPLLDPPGIDLVSGTIGKREYRLWAGYVVGIQI